MSRYHVQVVMSNIRQVEIDVDSEADIAPVATAAACAQFGDHDHVEVISFDRIVAPAPAEKQAGRNF